MKKEIRKEIDIIDEEIFKLFEKRMNLVKIIAGRKLKNNENIENKIREEEILKKISKIKDVSFYLKEWYIKLFELTKDYQNTIKSRENHGLYGLVGKGLKHTYSENVYKFLDIENYKIIDLNETEFENFIEKSFVGINVTMPYKEKIMKYVDHKEGITKILNAANVILNIDGKLHSYNTDYLGFKNSLKYHSITSLTGMKVAILGSGCTSKVIKIVLNELNAKEILTVSRKNLLNYDNFKKYHKDSDVVVNATPIGMYPNVDSLIDLKEFKNLKIAIDCIYNPLRTKFLLSSMPGVKIINGMFMLINQAYHASKIFNMTSKSEIDMINFYKNMVKEKTNIVLTGMPGSGKTTIGKILSKIINKEFVDIDTLIEQKSGKKICELMIDESNFRNLESDIVDSLKYMTNLIIATGGGTILKKENIENLKHNGIIFLIKRPIEILNVKNKILNKNIFELYEERKEEYEKSSEIIVDNLDLDKAVFDVKKEFENIVNLM